MQKLYFQLDGVITDSWLLSIYSYYIDNYKYCSYEDFLSPNGVFSNLSDRYKSNMAIIEHFYYKHSPNYNSAPALNTLSEKYEIGYIARRPSLFESGTIKYLKEYNFPNPENIFFASGDMAYHLRKECVDNFVASFCSKELEKITKLFVLSRFWNKHIPYERRINNLWQLVTV